MIALAKLYIYSDINYSNSVIYLVIR